MSWNWSSGILAQSTADGWVGYLGHTAEPAPSWLFYTEGRLRIRRLG